MRRRQVLAGGAALLAAPLAGCGHPPNVLDMSEATDRDVANAVAVAAPPESDAYPVLEEAVANGTALVSDTAPPVDERRPVAFEGRYYDVSVTEVDSREAVRYEVRVDYDPGDATPAAGEIAYGDLPQVDRDALAGLVPPDGDPPRSEGYDVGAVTAYPEGEAEESVLVPEQECDFVTYEGESVRVDVERRTVRETDYRVGVTEVADSTAAFADRVRSRYRFVLAGLSDAERDVVSTAIEDGYFGEATDAFRSVIARLLAHRAIDGSDGYGTWLVAYEGTEYVTYAEFPPDVTPAR